jgi:hypothetical protein
VRRNRIPEQVWARIARDFAENLSWRVKLALQHLILSRLNQRPS